METMHGCELARSGNSSVRVPVRVRLFGILVLLTYERLVEFTLPKGSTVADVLGELGKRFGADFIGRILRVPGELRSYCALFANGQQVNDLTTEVAAGRAEAEISVMLFTASDGG